MQGLCQPITPNPLPPIGLLKKVSIILDTRHSLDYYCPMMRLILTYMLAFLLALLASLYLAGVVLLACIGCLVDYLRDVIQDLTDS